QNYSRWTNPAFHDIASQVERELDDNRRKALVHKAEDILEQDPPLIPVSYEQIYDAWYNKVHGQNPSTYFGIYDVVRWDQVWLGDIAAGRLGKSFFRGDTVSEQILHRGPISAEIGVLALIVSWLVGLPVGILSAFKPNSMPDGLARALSVLFIAIPGFWLGMLIVLALLFWFGYKAPIVIVHFWQDPWQNLQIVIGPGVVLGLAQGAYIA